MNNRRIRITNAAPALLRPLPGLKPYNIVTNEDNETAEITMYGEVVESVPVDWWTGEPVEGLFIVLSDFLNDIANLQNKKSITVRLNSVGGDLEAGVSIYNRLKEMNNVTTIVDGLAASAASLILQAGKIRKAYSSSQVMAHGAAVGLCGAYNLQDLDGVRDMLQAANNQVIAIYEETTGQTKVQLKHIVEKTTWMTGQEIIDNGFADEIITGKEVTMSMSSDRSLFLCNGIPMNSKRLASMPNNVQVIPKQKTEQTVKTDANKPNNNEGGKIMTLEEMKAQYPDLVKQVENAAKSTVNTTEAETTAAANERKRIQDIESIENSIGDKELVKAAKYGEHPMDAKELAFQAMQKQSQLGNQFLQNNNADVAASGTEDVQADPNSGVQKDGPKDEASDIMAAVNAAKQIRGGK